MFVDIPQGKIISFPCVCTDTDDSDIARLYFMYFHIHMTYSSGWVPGSTLHGNPNGSGKKESMSR